MDNKQLNILDAMAIVSFFVGLANYGEILDQSSAQKLFDSALADIHSHLKEQDEKINKILERVSKDV